MELLDEWKCVLMVLLKSLVVSVEWLVGVYSIEEVAMLSLWLVVL